MKFKTFLSGLLFVLLAILLMPPILDVNAQDGNPPLQTSEPPQGSVEVVNDYYSVVTATLADGTEISALKINGPSEPPDRAAFEASRVSVVDRAATLLPNFPSYSWVYGCSAVSGAMIAAYYDNNGYPNLYSGPTNGGVMPQTDTSWPTWSDGYKTYPNNPLIASHKNIDGRGEYVLGSIDDYWVSYFSPANDPYITNSWAQHTWGTAIGDYMKTSQSAWPIENPDGATQFWNYGSNQRMYCDDMPFLADPNLNDPNYFISETDGTYGRKLFYEERGYTVTDCFNQYSDNMIAGGFSLLEFQNEIDAGHPVMLNLHNFTTGEGHTVVGYGYDGNRIYIRNTWDSNPNIQYYMNWDGLYQNMELISVSIVHLGGVSPDFSKTSPSNGAVGLNPNAVTLAWEDSAGALSYDYCIDTEPDCIPSVNTGMNTSVTLSALVGPETYYWQVRANGSAGMTYANGAEGAVWSFTTFDPALMTEKNFIPLLSR